MNDTVLKVEELRTWFRTSAGFIRVVDGVSFHLRKGQVLGLVGESGSGKTMTALSILRLVPRPGFHPSGSILFHGENLLSLPEARLRHYRGNHIAMAFQGPSANLNPYLPVGVQVGEVLEVHRGLTRRQALKQAIELLAEVGIPDPETRALEYPHQLSEGTRQRVLLATVIGCRPEVLIADEPTTGIDGTHRYQIRDLLLRLATDYGSAILVITHDLGSLVGFAQEVAVMYAGRMVELASITDLFRNPRHPYTRTLLASRISLMTDALPEPPRGLPIELPDVGTGCAWAERCTLRCDRWDTSPPWTATEAEAERGHGVACWRHVHNLRSASPGSPPSTEESGEAP